MRVLFVNRMAAMQRGGGETFDLEMATQMARMGHEVTVLAGWPVFRRRPETEGRRPETVDYRPEAVDYRSETEDQGPKTEIRGQRSEVGSQLSIGQSSTNQEGPLLPSTFNLEPSTLAPGLTSTVYGLRSMVLLRSPYLPWFPWDKVKGGWRVRVWEFQQFERKAAKWIEAHQDEFDIIQICELPYLVSLLKQDQRLETPDQRLETRDRRPEVKEENDGLTSQVSRLRTPCGGQASLRSKLVLRLTAPNAYDAWGGIQLADAVIASGTSIDLIRRALRPDVVDVPNGVDLKRFKVQGSRLKVQGSPEPGDKREGFCLQPSTFNLQPSTCDLQSSTFNPQPDFRAKHAIPPSAPVLLYVARFQAFKHHRLLIDAFGRVLREQPETWLVLAGSGPLMTEAKDLCRSLKVSDKVVFLGETPFDQLPDIYAAADIKVISSDYESFCFAAIEAMATGLPVVTTDCGWVPRLLGDSLPPIEQQWYAGDDPPERFGENAMGERIREAPGGLVVGRDDSESLASAILRMLADPALAQRCGAWNREKAVREHGWESSARKLLDVYERLAAVGHV